MFIFIFLTFLEQCRTFQLLGLMFQHKDTPMNLRVIACNTRGADRDQFYVERYNNCKYKNSPFYKGAELWKLLPIHITWSDSLFQFKQSLKKQYRTYVDVMS